MKFKVGDKVTGVDFSIHRNTYKFKDSGLIVGKVYTVVEVGTKLSILKVDSTSNWYDVRRFIPATELTIELN